LSDIEIITQATRFVSTMPYAVALARYLTARS
jgi:hypothetical protein